MPSLNPSHPSAPDQFQQLRAALDALRHNASAIPVERARLIVACAFNAIDVLRIEHTTSRSHHDTQQEQDQDH